MENDIYINDHHGNDVVTRKSNPWVNIHQENKCSVKVKQEPAPKNEEQEDWGNMQ